MKSHFGFQGKYVIKTYRTLPGLISRFIPKKLYAFIHKSGLSGGPLRVSPEIKNLIVLNDSHGLNLFLQHLGGNDLYPLNLDNASIGSGTNAPDDLDTDLQTPVVENIIRATVDINTDNIVTEWFITNDELPNGTYNEFGLFCGTQLFCRSIIDPAHTKASNEDTLIEYTITAENTI